MFHIVKAGIAAVAIMAFFFVGTVFMFFVELAAKVSEEN
jgi:hypothetical protein